MSHRIISWTFALACAAATFIFSQRPPRAQARLAAVDSAIQQALRGQPCSRIFFGPVTDTEAFVWCRYFVSPRLLLDSEAHSGDTVLLIFKTGNAEPFNTAVGKFLADAHVDSARAVLYIAR